MACHRIGLQVKMTRGHEDIVRLVTITFFIFRPESPVSPGLEKYKGKVYFKSIVGNQ